MLLVVLFRPMDMAPAQERVLGVLTALAAGFLGYFFAGAIEVRHRLVRAAGGAAIFVVVLVFWWGSSDGGGQGVVHPEWDGRRMSADAFAVGSAFAQLGASSTGAAEGVLELSLGDLGFPEHQLGVVTSEFRRLDRDALAAGADADGTLQARKDVLFERVRGSLQVLHGAPLAAHVDLGHDVTRFLLLLRSWHDLEDQPGLDHAVKDVVAALRESAAAAPLPEDLRRRLVSLDGPSLRDPAGRKRVLELLDSTLARFDRRPQVLAVGQNNPSRR